MALEEIVLPDGTTRRLGNIIPTVGLTKAWPVFGDVPDTKMLTEEQLKAAAISAQEAFANPLLPPIHDQDGIGMCNCSATAAALEDTRTKQGLPYVSLSGGDLYQRISGGRDQGSLLEDGLAVAMSQGIAATSVVPYLDWRGENQGAAESRKRYRVLEAFLCPTFQHCASAVAGRFSLISGVMWFNNYKPDGDGWLPMRGSGGGGGHAVFGHTLVIRGSDLGIAHDNSWTVQWGVRGMCVFPKPMYSGPVGGWWAVREVVDEGGIVPMA